jgi:hypothetical protein
MNLDQEKDQALRSAKRTSGPASGESLKNISENKVSMICI